MIRYMYIHPTAVAETNEVSLESRPQLELGFLQGLVGGNLEAVGLSLGHVMYIHEEGKLVGARFNDIASRLAREGGLVGDHIVGPAVVVKAGASGDEESVTAEMIELVLGLGVEVREEPADA